MKQKQLKRKTIIVTLVFLAVGGILFKSIFTTSMQIYEKKKENMDSLADVPLTLCHVFASWKL